MIVYKVITRFIHDFYALEEYQRPPMLLFRMLPLLAILLVAVALPGYTQEVPQTSSASSTQTPENYRKAVETFANLDQSNNYTESLSYADMNVLPMGLKQTLNNISVTIAVSDMRWETTHSELTVFARLIIPQYDKPLFFGAQGIKLSHEGDIIGDASLVLMGDFSIPIHGGTAALTLKGSFDTNSGRAKEMTFVSIDCLGFKEMGISADVEFPQSLLKQVDDDGNELPGRVKGSFKTIVKDWNDVMASPSRSMASMVLFLRSTTQCLTSATCATMRLLFTQKITNSTI
jgi:hypothetical protein